MPGLGQFHYSFVSNRPKTLVLVTFFLPFKSSGWLSVFFVFNFWETLVLSLESLIPLLLTSGDIYLGF